MKKTTLAITLSTLITLTSSAQALELLVVNNYNDAAMPELWKKARTDEVPEALMKSVSLSGPTFSYASLFPKTFLQEELFAVCHQNCNDKDIFSMQNGEISSRDKLNWNVIEQSNVYFWLNKYFSFIDSNLQFQPRKFLKVITNREIVDETKGKIMQNNAFFNPRDISLSFLPATKSLLFKLTGGKINRSGFDPSVVAHESSHYLFNHLFSNPVNTEINGLDEGIADYIANIFLNNPKVGMVMMHGQALRDSSNNVDKAGKLKTYEPRMEVHDLGERISYALWKTRALSNDKSEMDRLVIDAIQDISRNPYSSVHDFKEKMLERLPIVIASVNAKNVATIWEITFPGKANRIDNLNFLNKATNSKILMGFKSKQVLPEALAREYGTPAVEKSNFSFLQIETISPTQLGILMTNEDGATAEPFWVVMDTARDNILGIYDLNKRLITKKDELERLKTLAQDGKGAGEFMKDFNSKIKLFAELAENKGEFSQAYKVINQTTVNETIIFNGQPVSGRRIGLDLKRRLLIGILFGLPEITKIELITVPVTELKSMPDLNGQKVIGYKLQLKTGTAKEIIMDKRLIE